MTSSRVLVIVFLASLIIDATQGLTFDQTKDFNPCAAAQTTVKGVALDVFCMGVKDGEIISASQ